MIKTVVVCDVCGAERTEKNHWFMACFSDMARGGVTSIRFFPWIDGSGDSVAHLCSQQCCITNLSRFLGQSCNVAQASSIAAVDAVVQESPARESYVVGPPEPEPEPVADDPPRWRTRTF